MLAPLTNQIISCSTFYSDILRRLYICVIMYFLFSIGQPVPLLAEKIPSGVQVPVQFQCFESGMIYSRSVSGYDFRDPQIQNEIE